jgi:ankyrin repeat protein
MIKPVELESAEGNDVWNTLTAAEAGDVSTLRRLLDGNPRLARAEYWYAPAIHFAAREGHLEAVRVLLASGADPERNGLNDRNLIEMARERGHEAIVRILERARNQRGRVVAQKADHPIHRAAARGDVDAVRGMLDDDPSIIDCGHTRGLTPLQLAVVEDRQPVVNLLLDRGANIHASGGGQDLQAIDLAVCERDNPDVDMARLLLSRGATYDLTVAAALGDIDAVRRMLDNAPSRIAEARPHGRRPLSAAVEFGHDDIVTLLLERGADPRWEEPHAPHGKTLHKAAVRGNLAIVKLLLDHGADPNEDIDSSASASVFAATPEIRELIESRGAELSPYDITGIEHDENKLRALADAPRDVFRIGAAITMSADRPELLARLLDAGLRMPDVHTCCQGYLVRPDALRTLLARGMSPDQTNWQHQTLLHHASTRDNSECAAILLDAGATITARDDDYRSTPLGWAARTNSLGLVEFLLSRGAPTHLPDDQPWATPLAWARRRGHTRVVEILRAAGAK